MSKFSAVMKPRDKSDKADKPEQAVQTEGAGAVNGATGVSGLHVGRPRGKRSDQENTQVTGYVPAQLYYDVKIKPMERKRRDRAAKTDFSDLLREWMQQGLRARG